VSAGDAAPERVYLVPSPTLRAIGCAPDELDGPLCFTLGRFSTAADVEAVLRQLPRIVARRRAHAPLGHR
jgi:cysteine sulfinate desulfinase/cysteine desulfurase-like protein